MQKAIYFLLMFILLLAGCTQPVKTAETQPATTTAPEVSEVKEYLPKDLLGMTPAQLISLFGPDFREVTPEGDPPYFCFDGRSPYRFCGSKDDPQITYIQGHEPDSGILPGLRIGSTLADIEAWAKENTELTYTPADEWYDDINGQYGWVFLMGGGYHYSFYIKDNVILSFECWMEFS